uniref:Uncharacterized protein n=1 Tax=Romanomermis culicivorax TaxID=13658 RepID=A0A915JEU7_ROMCU
MDTTVQEINIDESIYTVKPNGQFHYYSPLLNNIDFQNRYSFPAPIYAYLLPTMASVHMQTAKE